MHLLLVRAERLRETQSGAPADRINYDVRGARLEPFKAIKWVRKVLRGELLEAGLDCQSQPQPQSQVRVV